MYLSFFVTLCLTIAFIVLGHKTSILVKKKSTKALLGVFFFILSLPAILFLIFSARIFTIPIWFIELRSLQGTDLLLSFLGLFLGFISPKSNGKVSLIKYNKYIYFICIFFVICQFLPYLIPPKYKNFRNNWIENVCLQSTGYTCGPASLATISQYYGKPTTELEVVKFLGVSTLGTRRWDFVKYARKINLKAECFYPENISSVPYPSIIEVIVKNKIPHAITLLGKDNGNYIIGDPLEGKLSLTEDEFLKKYKFDGFAVHFTKE